jgi:hypothetical protein
VIVVVLCQLILCVYMLYQIMHPQYQDGKLSLTPRPHQDLPRKASY